MTVIPRCGICEPTADAEQLMDGLTEAVCAHCGWIVRRHRKWKPDGAGILIGADEFICTPPDEQLEPTVPAARA